MAKEDMYLKENNSYIENIWKDGRKVRNDVTIISKTKNQNK